MMGHNIMVSMRNKKNYKKKKELLKKLCDCLSGCGLTNHFHALNKCNRIITQDFLNMDFAFKLIWNVRIT